MNLPGTTLKYSCGDRMSMTSVTERSEKGGGASSTTVMRLRRATLAALDSAVVTSPSVYQVTRLVTATANSGLIQAARWTATWGCTQVPACLPPCWEITTFFKLLFRSLRSAVMNF